MTLATDVVTFIGNNPEATSLDGSVSENLFAASVEHYKVRQAVGVAGLENVLPTRVAQAYAQAGWSRTSVNGAGDASYVTLASVVVPAGLMGPNSKLVIISDWDCPSSASVKWFAVDFGGTNIGQPTLTTSVMLKLMQEVQNLNSLSSQKTMNGSSYGASSNPRLSSSIDTSANVTIDFKVKWTAAAASETITLLGYSIWHYPGS